MTRILTVHSKQFTNALHFQFATEFKDKSEAHSKVVAKAQPQYDEVMLWYDREDRAFKLIRKSELSELKATVDHERDKLFFGLHATVKAALNHYDPSVAGAATRLAIVLDNYNRNPPVTSLSYDAETAAITNLMQDLNLRQADVKLVGVDGWTQSLDAKNKEFELLAKESIDESTAKPDYNMRQARRGFDQSLHTFFSCIDALAIMDGNDEIADYIAGLNAIIKHYNDVYAQHHGRIEAAKKEE
jgi:hypothetical protein